MRYARFAAALGIAVCCGGAVQAGDSTDLSCHGLRLGMSEAALSEDFPEFKCEADGSNPELRRCKGKFDPTKSPGPFQKLRGSHVESLLTFRGGKLVNIHIPFYTALFEPGSLFFVQYYGQPKMTQGLIKNGQGTERENTTLIWTQGSESIIYWKIDEDRFMNGNDDTSSRILFVLKEDT